MRGRKIFCVLLALAMVFSLVGCGGGTRTDSSDSSYPLPSWVSERSAATSENTGDGNVNVNFYYDNTMGMYPFVCDENGNSNVNGKATVSGPLVNWIAAVREILQNNNGTTYTLQPNSENELHWEVYEGDVHNNFSNKSFYTTTGSLPMDGDAEVGPLAQLYYENNIDPTAVNIVLTDLAEQSVNNTELASCINNNILSQDGYAAAIIAVECEFNGTAYVPNPSTVSQLLSDKVDDERPLYMILTGPDSQLETIYQTLISAMQQQGMEENENYYTYYQSSESTVNRVSSDDIVIAPELVESTSNSFKNYIEYSTIYDNLSLVQLSNSETADLFGSNDYLIVDLNAFAYSKAKNTSRIILNYYIPLEEYSSNYTWRIAESADSDASSVSGTDVTTLLEGKDYIVYDYLTSETVEVEADESTEEDTNSRRRSNSRNSTTTVTEYSWVNDEGNGTTLKDFEDSFIVTAEQIDFESDEDHVLAGADIYDKNGNAVDSTGNGSRGSASYQLDEADEIDLSAADHWIHLSIEGNVSSYDSSVVAFSIPIYAYATSDSSLPAWVTELNATASDVGDDDYFTHTFNLTGFYATLFGVNTSSNATLTQLQQEVKIADIVTVLTDLPVSKSSR